MPIDASKYTDKEQLISKFYAMRAGLSAIAEEHEKIKFAEKALADAQNDYNLEISRNQRLLDECEAEANRCKTLVTQKDAEIDAAKKKKAGVLYGILSFIASFFIFYVFIACYASKPALMEKHYDTLLYAAWPVIFSLTIILYILATIIVRRKTVEKLTNELTELQAKYNSFSPKVRRLALELERVKNVNENSFGVKMTTLEAQYKNSILPQSNAKILSIKKALLETSKGVLCECDWYKLDLLIYYLETGLADSLKEALLLAETQSQTNQIKNAINTAANHISYTIRASMDEVKGLLSLNFEQLSQTIKSNHTKTMNAFLNLESAVNTNNEKISNLNAAVISERELEAAFRKRSNESSEKLVSLLEESQNI